MYRTPVEIHEPIVSDNGTGGQLVAWQRAFTWWAKARAVRGRETELHGRLSTLETWLLVGHYDSRITSQHRAVINGQTLNIRTVQDRDGHRTQMTVECEAGVPT